MFNILKLPTQDSHLEEFEAAAEQARRDGNARDAEHWGTMANAEKIIAGQGTSEQETNKRS